MYQERKKFGFELLLSNLRKNFGRMMLVNLIFALPLFASVAVSWVLYRYLIPVVTIAFPVVFIIAMPFYPGVVVCARYFSQNIRPESIIKTYFKAVKENALKFLLCGVFMYLAFVGCYYGVGMYSSMASYISWMFYIILFFMILISVFFVFLFYALPLMTVSFDLKFKDIYKNSALMTFGELKNNFFATIGVVAYLAVFLMPVIIISYLASVLPVETVKWMLMGYIALAFGVLIPSQCSMIISNYLYPNMRAVISGDDISYGNTSAPAPNLKSFDEEEKLQLEVDSSDDLSLEQLRQGDAEDYVFYRGKMIKRKILLNNLERKDEET